MTALWDQQRKKLDSRDTLVHLFIIAYWVTSMDLLSL